jgi:hypothetical protein
MACVCAQVLWNPHLRKRACNSHRIRTSKTQDLKSFRIRTYEKTGGGRGRPWVAQTSVCAGLNLTDTQPRETYRPELEEDCVAGATAGAASLIKIGHRGNAKFPATSSITFTWQT